MAIKCPSCGSEIPTGPDAGICEEERFLLEEYKQCWEDWRHYNSIIWQLPAVSTAIVGGLLGVAYYAIAETTPRGVVILLASFFAVVMNVALIKHRYFHSARTRRIDSISLEKLKRPSPIRGFPADVQPKLAKPAEDRHRIITKIPAYYFLLAAMISLFVATLYLALLELL